jgi:hypothetical protein
MPLIVKPGYTIYYAHVPKAGGTSVEDYLIRRFGPMMLSGRSHVRPGKRRVMVSPPQHLAATDLADFLPEQIDYSFAVVRDPLDRIVSEYRFQSGFSLASRLSFSTWLRVVSFGRTREPRLYDNHVRPMVDIVPEGAEAFKLEEGFEGLVARLDAVTGTTTPDLAIEHLLKTERKPAVRVLREDAALIARVYAADYARFGYSLPELSAYPADAMASLRDVIARPLAAALVRRQRKAYSRI